MRKTHWDAQSTNAFEQASFGGGSSLGPNPAFWAGPAQLMKIRERIGMRAFMENMQASMSDFLIDSQRWIKINTTTGKDAVLERFLSLLDGELAADEGCILSLG
jgi:hypothetical protein